MQNKSCENLCGIEEDMKIISQEVLSLKPQDQAELTRTGIIQSAKSNVKICKKNEAIERNNSINDQKYKRVYMTKAIPKHILYYNYIKGLFGNIIVIII